MALRYNDSILLKILLRKRRRSMRKKKNKKLKKIWMIMNLKKAMKVTKMKSSKIIIMKTRLGFQDKDSNSEILDDQALIDEIIDADDSKSNDDDTFLVDNSSTDDPSLNRFSDSTVNTHLIDKFSNNGSTRMLDSVISHCCRFRPHPYPP
jgi:hypothetical protein